MKFATKLRLAMRAKAAQLDKKSIGAQYLSKETKGKLGAIHISELVDARVDPTIEDIELLSKALNVPMGWLAGKNNTPPIQIISFCKNLGLLPASFKGELTDDMLSHMMELLQHKENQ